MRTIKFILSILLLTNVSLTAEPYTEKKLLDRITKKYSNLKNAIIVAGHISQCSVQPHDEIVDGLSQKGIILAYDGMILEF